MGCSSIIQIKKKKFKKGKEIGNSVICHSFLISSIKTDKEYAYKLVNINANKEEKKKILNDIEFLKKIDHPNIILLKDVYYSFDKKILNIITEYADGGDLQRQINEKKEKN